MRTTQVQAPCTIWFKISRLIKWAWVKNCIWIAVPWYFWFYEKEGKQNTSVLLHRKVWFQFFQVTENPTAFLPSAWHSPAETAQVRAPGTNLVLPSCQHSKWPHVYLIFCSFLSLSCPWVNSHKDFFTAGSNTSPILCQQTVGNSFALHISREKCRKALKSLLVHHEKWEGYQLEWKQNMGTEPSPAQPAWKHHCMQAGVFCVGTGGVRQANRRQNIFWS